MVEELKMIVIMISHTVVVENQLKENISLHCIGGAPYIVLHVVGCSVEV